MISLLAKLFIVRKGELSTKQKRSAYGVLCSVVGIVFNVLLFCLKYFAGILSGSIAITADAFNNLSDAGSSLITLVGFKFADRKPDPQHPFGHGRIEYLSGLLVAMAILLMGFELAKTSIEKIITPEPVQSGALVIVILAVSICVKLYMFFYNNRIGKNIDSAAMRATGMDSLSDTVATTVVLVATIVSRWTDFNIDGWCGVLVALFIFYAGINAARETLGPLLGQPPSAELIQQIENIVLAHPQIVGIHDLVVHDYGPGRMMISLHGEVPGNGNIYELHDVIDQAELELNNELGCQAIIHMDPIAVDNEQVSQRRLRLTEMVKQLGDDVSLHDFRMVQGPTHTNLIFDAVVPYDLKLSDDEAIARIAKLVHDEWPECFCVIQIDRPYVAAHGK